MASMSSEELNTWGESFEAKQPHEVVAAAIERYAPKIVLACSFGAEDVVLVDMVHTSIPPCRSSISIRNFSFPRPMPRVIA